MSNGVVKLKIREDFEAKEILDREQQETLTPSGDIYETSAASTSRGKCLLFINGWLILSNTFRTRPSSTSGIRRKRGLEDPVTSSKQPKVDKPLIPLMTRAPKDVQCAFYGIERLRHSMDITHSMSVLLNGEELFFSH